MNQELEYYQKQISLLESEIAYLHGILDKSGIPYRRNIIVNDIPEDNTDDLRQSEMTADQGGRIKPEIITSKHVSYFYSVFKGRKDVYSKRSAPNKDTGKAAYYTQCWNYWKDGLCPRKSGYKIKCDECKNQSHRELTPQILYNHLVGVKEDCSDVIGLYAMHSDETCNFLVFDFDNHDEDNADSNEWIREVNIMRDICKNNDVPILVERSRSGKGAHIWLVFSEAVPAATARKFGSALLTKGAESVNMKSFIYYDRMIPAQDHLPVNMKTGKTGLGNLVALPLQGMALKNGNSAFIDENWNAYENQWQILKNVKRISESFINDKIKEWGADNVLGLLGDNTENETSSDVSGPWEKKLLAFDSSDVSGKMQIVLADKVYISTKNIKPRLQNLLRRMAAFSNPEFYKKSRMGFSVKGISRIIYCGSDEGGYICLPRSLIESVETKANEAGIEYSIDDERCNGKNISVDFKGELYPEQQDAVNCIMKHENGVIAATTAFGKTVVGANMISVRKVNTLILVHNTEILKNWTEDLEKFLIIDEELPEYKTKTGRIRKRKSVIGKLYAGHNSLTGIVDVAMFSSIGQKEELSSLIQNYGMVIMDECHHGAAQTVEDVIGTVRARWVYGLTATPKRDDGMEKKVYMQFGPVRYRYTAKERAAKQGINHFVYPRFTRMVSSSDLKINEAYKAVVSSEIRNRQIINDVEKCISEGRTPLVLSKYKEHAEILYKMLEDKSDHIFLLQGGGSRKEKDRIREEMRSVPEDETVILVAIDKYIGEGFNYPRLDTMMLTMPVAWEGNVEQYAGRLHRDYESKKNVIIYDYVDVNIRVLEKMYHKRLRTYKKIGYEICSSIITEKQETNSVYDMSSYLNVYQRDLAEANSEIIISSPGLNKTSLTNFLNLIQKKQEDGVMITVVTLDAESYPAERIEAAAKLIGILRLNGINVVLKKYMHEHFAIIDKEIVWYGSVNLLSSVREEDNIMRIKSTEISQELMEITFSENEKL